MESDGWVSNSSADDSSTGDFDGRDMPVITDTVDLDMEDDEFPREDFTILMEGLNKYPWTVYPHYLTACLTAAAKLAHAGTEEVSEDARRLRTLYQDGVPATLEKCLDEKVIIKWSDDIHNNIFESLLRLIDLVVVKLGQYSHARSSEDTLASEEDVLPLLRSLSLGLDKLSQFQNKHKDDDVPARAHHVRQSFAKPAPGQPVKVKNYDWLCNSRRTYVTNAEGCKCQRCQPPESYLWLSYLLNYLGQSQYGNGYAELLRLVKQPARVSAAMLEALLQILARAIEFATPSVINAFLDPCKNILAYVAGQLEKDIDSLSDKTRDASYSALSQTLKHLQAVLERGLAPVEADRLVSSVQRRMVELMLGLSSFNKQLSAVREINKLLDNARASSFRDESEAVRTTIDWLEKKDILKKVLRCHLHHKQYVDQVEKIMRFLLQERRLSEEHLDVTWAATEKPDQFETVKSNIYDLLADLAWSFSDAQLDSLFGRFERRKGRLPEDNIKILQLVKKLARSDTKGVMADRLLELLWHMIQSGEAQTEILDSGALTEILGHYDSVKCANKEEYIERCLKTIEQEQSVVVSLRLLREIIMLDSERPFHPGNISRKARVDLLLKRHNLFSLIVSSLELYMKRARSLCPEVVHEENVVDLEKLVQVDQQYTHYEQIAERLNFLAFSLDLSAHYLQWKETHRIWDCLVEGGIFVKDQEQCLDWFCHTLRRLNTTGQTNLLTCKLMKLDPTLINVKAYRCFLRLFEMINMSKEKLRPRKDQDASFTTVSLDLVGLPYLWSIALKAPAKDIAEEAIFVLRNVYTNLSDLFEGEPASVHKDFTSEVLQHLRIASALREAGDSQEAQAVDLCQAERCLRLLQVYLTRCEGKCSRRQPPHGASYQGMPFKLEVQTAVKGVSRLELDTHSNEALGSVRAKLAQRLDVAPGRLRLLWQGRDLQQDAQVLRTLGISEGHVLQATVTMVERPSDTGNEEELPGVILSKQQEVYDILFQLTQVQHASVRENAMRGLQLLPTHPGILKDFQALAQASTAEEAQRLLSHHFGARDRLLYTLQVLDGILVPVNRKEDHVTHHFRQAFKKYSGLQYLLAVFEPGALPPSADNDTRRGCYTCAMRLLNLLLLEQPEETSTEDQVDMEPHAAASSDGSEKMEAEESPKLVDADPLMAEVGPSSTGNGAFAHLDLQRSMDVETVAGTVMRLAWAAALGHMHAVTSATDLASIETPTEAPSDDADDLDIVGEDAYLATEALHLLEKILTSRPQIVDRFFSGPMSQNFILDLTLKARSEYVRLRASAVFQKLSLLQDDDDARKVTAAQKCLLRTLLEARKEAAAYPHQCQEYWQLFCEVVLHADGSLDQASAEKLMAEEVACLDAMPAVLDETDHLLEGRLTFIRVLLRRSSKAGGGPMVVDRRTFIDKLVKQCLFPEAAFFGDDHVRSGEALLKMGIAEATELLQAKCGTQQTRSAAFQLLAELGAQDVENLRHIVELLVQLHFSKDVADWDYAPSSSRKVIGNYVGLKNAGATCYMNSVFQQLYMQPEVRQTLLSCPECPDSEKDQSVFYQVQAMFGALQGSILDHYMPTGFWAAYRDYDGLPINLREHQDAFEFFVRLYDQLDESLKAHKHEPTLTRIFGGTFAQQVICRGCPHRSEREEHFAAISVDVKNKKDLAESLESFVRGDLLEGDNAYHCEVCNKKVDALKRVCVKSLPHTLVVHLKRFDFDYETMQRLKLKDRFEFPTALNMRPYTVEGLAGSEDSGASSSEAMAVEGYYDYELVGILVHSGSAFAGHYYSYIKERQGDCPADTKELALGRWLAFDDKRVEPYNTADLEKDCFGGKYVLDVYDSTVKSSQPQEFERPHSAYMLIYERSTPSQQLVTSETANDSLDQGLEQRAGSTDTSLQASTSKKFQPIHLPPSVHRSVLQENLRFVHEKQLMDPDYFAFLHLLLRHSITQLIENKVAAADRALEQEVAPLCMQLTLHFWMRVYLRTHSSLREDLANWKALMWRLTTGSYAACLYLIRTLTANPNWLQLFLLKCPLEEVRLVFAQLIVHAVNTAVRTPDSVGADLAEGLMEQILALLPEVTPQKVPLTQYLGVLNEFARLGDAQRDFLARRQLVGLLVTIAIRTQTASLLHQLDLTYLHSCVALLVRGADLSPLTRMDEEEEADSEERDGTLASSDAPATNPFSLAGNLTVLHSDAIHSIFRNAQYVSLLVSTYPHSDGVTHLLECCSWQNLRFSRRVLSEVMEQLRRASAQEARLYLGLLVRFCSIPDRWQPYRVEVVLLGCKGGNYVREGVLDWVALPSKTGGPHKRYLLLKFATKVVAVSNSARRLVTSKRAEWEKAVEWLQDEIMHASPVPISTSASNEDGSSTYLQRTKSALWVYEHASDVISP